jgi:hypothetical protein
LSRSTYVPNPLSFVQGSSGSPRPPDKEHDFYSVTLLQIPFPALSPWPSTKVVYLSNRNRHGEKDSRLDLDLVNVLAVTCHAGSVMIDTGPLKVDHRISWW